MAKILLASNSKFSETRNAYINRIENQRELSIQNKMNQAIEAKQRYLTMYDQMAKQPTDSKKGRLLNSTSQNDKETNN